MNERTSRTVEYLRALEASCKLGWAAAFNALSEHSTLYQRLALLHPQHIADSSMPTHLTLDGVQRSLQGPRAFGASLGGQSCQSSLLWGYECPLNAEIQQDHLFPYSLGGPTLPLNRIYLCRYHNMVKTSDVHSFPWEHEDKWIAPWLTAQVSKVHRDFFALYA
jgi:hypothetical protein